MGDENLLRNYLIEMYKRNLVFNMNCRYENYIYTYDEDLDELHLVHIDINENVYITLHIVDVFDIIDSYAINLNSDIKILYLGSKVKYISEHAFNNSFLTEVIIDSSDIPLVIGCYAFSECCKLTTFKCNRIYKIHNYAFSCCFNLFDIDLSSAVYISKNSFMHNKCLKSIYLNAIIKLDEFSFFHCINLEFIYIGEHLLSLNSHTFMGCTQLKEVVFDSNCEFSFDAFSALLSFRLYLKYQDTILNKATKCDNSINLHIIDNR